MKYIYILLLICLIGCKPNKDSQEKDFKTYLTDRIWLTDHKVEAFPSDRRAQYYFSSEDNIIYIWDAVRNPDDIPTHPFVRAEGNPHTHPFPRYVVLDSEGWKKAESFKIEGDTLFFQEIQDVEGKSLTAQHLSQGKDTTLGVHDYKTIKVKFGNEERTWMTKINSNTSK